MSQRIEIVCPSCGFKGYAPPEKIPARSVKLNCNQCKNEFQFDGKAAHELMKAMEPPPEPTVASAVAKPSVTEAESLIPDSPTSGTTVPSQERMSAFWALMNEGWQIFKDRFLRLLGLWVMLLIPIALVGVLSAVLIPGFQDSVVVVALFILIVATILTIVFGWGLSATMVLIVDGDLSFTEAVKKGWELVWSYLWFYSVYGFIVFGCTMLFGIPGIIAAIVFVPAPYLLVVEGERGMGALHKSAAYVDGFGLSVFWKMICLFLVGILVGLVAMIPILGIFIQLVWTMFCFIFYYVIYQDLQRIKGSVVAGNSAKVYLWMALGGYVLMILVGIFSGFG